MSRKHIEIPWQKVEALCQVKFSAKAISTFIGVGEETLLRAVKRVHGMTFTEYAEKYAVDMKHKLIQKAVELALGGNVTMLIFTLKNICGWSDKVDIPEESVAKNLITLNYKL